MEIPRELRSNPALPSYERLAIAKLEPRQARRRPPQQSEAIRVD